MSQSLSQGGNIIDKNANDIQFFGLECTKENRRLVNILTQYVRVEKDTPPDL